MILLLSIKNIIRLRLMINELIVTLHSSATNQGNGMLTHDIPVLGCHHSDRCYVNKREIDWLNPL